MNLDEIAAEHIDGVHIKFGPYAGEMWTRLPSPYLKFLVRQGDWPGEKAAKVLAKRGDTVSQVTLTMHAINRFSQRYNYDKELGIITDLTNKVNAAVNIATLDCGNNTISYEGIRFVINNASGRLTLITVK